MQVTDANSSPLARLMEGAWNVLRTGSWEGEEPTTEQLLDEAEEQARHDAEVMADALDEALTEYHTLQARLTRAQEVKTLWFERLEQAGRALTSCSDAERTNRQDLLQQARTEYERAKRVVDALSSELEEVEPLADSVLATLEEAGVSRDEALSSVSRMRIESASAETRQRLAMARANVPNLTQLLSAARGRIDEKTAEAMAWEDIAPETTTDPHGGTS